MKKLTRALFGFAAALTIASSAHAAPFSITGLSFAPGTGYGVGSGTPGVDDPDYLNALFTTAAAPGNFNLNVGQSFKFTFGSVALIDTCVSEHITGNNYYCAKGDETDKLGVTANFIFTNPYAGTSMVSATGTAYGGSVSGDLDADLTIDFGTTYVDFGNGGRFSIDLGDLSFTNNSTLTTSATVTLLSDSVTPAAVPEPASLALFGLGLLGAGLVRRRKSA